MTEVTIQQTELEVNIINPFDDLIKASISSRIEKLNVKTFFLFNPNLAYPCKISEEIEAAFTKKSKGQVSSKNIATSKGVSSAKLFLSVRSPFIFNL